MPLTKIQVEVFRNLLDQLTSYSTTDREVEQIHKYLFEQPVSISFPEDSSLIEAIDYLSEMIESQQFASFDEMMSYFDRQGTEMDEYFDDIVHCCKKVTELIDFDDYINGVVPNNKPVDPDTGQQFLSGKYSAWSFKPTINYFQDVFTRRPKKKTALDIYSTFKLFFNPLGHTQTYNAINYCLALDDESRLIGGNYIKQFLPTENVGSLFILQFNDQKGITQEFYNPISPGWSTFDWAVQYFNARQAPDYYTIIDVIREEKPIDDKRFKFALFEWLIYSKVMMSDCLHLVHKRQKEVVFSESTYYQAFKDLDLIYYSGHGFGTWINRLFETRLLGKKWRILKSPDQQFWLTSDNPGFLVNISELETGKRSSQPAHSLAEIRSDTVLYYPLSKDYCLRIEPSVALDYDIPIDSSIQFERSSEDELYFVNEQTMSTHQELVIGNQKQIVKQFRQLAKNARTGRDRRDGQCEKPNVKIGQFLDQKCD